MMLLRTIEKKLELFAKSAWAERHLFGLILTILTVCLALWMSVVG